MAGELGPWPLNHLFEAVNFLCTPVIFYTGTMILFFAALYFRKVLVKPAVAFSIGIVGILFLLVSLANEQFRREATKAGDIRIEHLSPDTILVHPLQPLVWIPGRGVGFIQRRRMRRRIFLPARHRGGRHAHNLFVRDVPRRITVFVRSDVRDEIAPALGGDP